jgi:hypothetical protein
VCASQPQYLGDLSDISEPQFIQPRVPMRPHPALAPFPHFFNTMLCSQLFLQLRGTETFGLEGADVIKLTILQNKVRSLLPSFGLHTTVVFKFIGSAGAIRCRVTPDFEFPCQQPHWSRTCFASVLDLSTPSIANLFS